VEGSAIGAYVVVGGIGALAGSGFLAHVLPLGTPGTLASAGTIVLLNGLVGVAVATGIVLLVAEFLEQTLLRGG
jgi:multicomponent Na+:H+ antiporter subunit B